MESSKPKKMMLYPPSMSLGQLLKQIREYNEDQWDEGKNSRQWRMKYGLDSLEDRLNKWDKICEKMWAGSKRDEAPTFKELCGLVEGGAKQIILTGAPGTGKTRTAGLIARHMGTSLSEYSSDPEYPCPLVQFHPSYDYTDFVEGLRPVQLEGQDDTARFVKLDGSFKAFCRSVAEENKAHTDDPKNDPSRRYFFLIDEINRADLSKVFGELMFCLEADKRGHPVQTQYRNLPTYTVDRKTRRAVLLPLEDDVFADGFFIPENVVILGTMNDIDRSVESMDFALHRRFEWREIEVDKALLVSAFQSGNFGPVLKKHADKAAERVMALNAVIDGSGKHQGGQFGLSRHYYVSQGQFAHLPEGKFAELRELMQYVWDRRISFLLREYVRGEDTPDIKSFLSECAEALMKVEADEQEIKQ